MYACVCVRMGGCVRVVNSSVSVSVHVHTSDKEPSTLCKRASYGQSEIVT